MFVILSGSAGVGKNTVMIEMQKQSDNIVLMPTFTTREKRDGEVEGLPYFYISKEEFQQKIKNNELIEHEFIHNNYYGSAYKIFDDFLSKNKIIIKDIGVEGAQNLSVKLCDRTKILKIFLTVKHKRELKKRLIGRGEKQVKLRLKRFSYEQKQMNKFDFIIFNESLELTTKLINTLIKIDEKTYIPCKEQKHINKYKIKYYINKLTSKEVLKPIKIAVYNEKIYIVKGVEKYIASILSEIPVAKLVIKKDIKEKYQNMALDNDWYKKII